MTHYSEQPGHVRCDQFRVGGKWYQTFTIDMSEMYWGPPHHDGDPLDRHRDVRGDLIHSAVRRAVEAKLGRPIKDDGMVYVVLDPYHENSHPIMLGASRG